MKPTFFLLFLWLTFVFPVASTAKAESPEADATPKEYSLTLEEFKTLKILDMDGKLIRDFCYKRTMSASKDEFLGLYVRDDAKKYYYVVRPLGGKPIKTISWRPANGARHFMVLEGRTVAEFFRDAQKNKQDMDQQWKNMEQELQDMEQQYASIQMRASLSKADVKTLYAKWSEKEGVSATYISKAMFKMIHKIPQIELDKPVDLTPVIQRLDGLYMLEFSNINENNPRNTVTGGLRKDIQAVLSGNGYEWLMEKRVGEQFTRLYVSSDGKTVTGFVLVRMDSGFNYGQFVCIEGKIPQAEFEALIAKAL